MDVRTVVTISVTVALALLGYLFTYMNNLRLARRKDRLDRVDRQLRDFYGPLFALEQASTRVWKAFREKNRPDGAYWGTPAPPSEDEGEVWRLWMKEVFMPLNTEMVKIITDHADLLEESEMPDILLELCAHVYGYKAVMRAWESGDFRKNTSVIDFPSEISQYAASSYRNLKREQSRLLGGK
jgi:hypothetical protein